jgi:hypothetical protein
MRRRIAVFALAVVVAAGSAASLPGQNAKDTPQGPEFSLQAGTNPKPGRFGVPLYPGASEMKDQGHRGIEFSLSTEAHPGVRLEVSKFQTSDPVEKVVEFYRQQLGKQVTKFTPKNDEGNSVFEIKHKFDQRFIEIKKTTAGSEIDLVRLEGVDSKDIE